MAACILSQHAHLSRCLSSSHPVAIHATATPGPTASVETLFEVVILRTGELVMDGLTRDQARAKARLMNSIASVDELVIWREDHRRTIKRILFNADHAAREMEPPKFADFTAQTDEDLMLQVQNGDMDAFGELVRRHRPRLLKRCLWMLNFNEADAEDCVQDALHFALAQCSRFKPGAKVYSWIYGVCQFRCRRLLEQRQRHKELNQRYARRPLKVATQPIDQLEQEELRQAMSQAVDKLPPRHTQVLRCHFYEGMSFNEIGKIRGTSHQAASLMGKTALDSVLFNLLTLSTPAISLESAVSA